ncbi:MAG: hypothetical protein ACSHWU_12335 [Marinicella sp.]
MFKTANFIALILVSSNAYSHEFLTQLLVFPEDSIKISPDSTFNIIETFHLTRLDLSKGYKKDLVKQEIKRIVAKSQEGVNPESVACDDWDGVFKTCGVFDHFNEARSIAIDLCAGVSVMYSEVYPDGLIPQFIGPETFIAGGAAAANHHDDYNFSHGLSFNCVEVISNLENE